ncbi:MAG TPA: Crp/Fnr family transcriptional regulator [bacterium]|nr:Crp/Fnr family transcriptional regulator [bacterium]
MWYAEPLRGTLEPLAHVRKLSRNEYLFRQGEVVSTIYEVLAGRLRMERRTLDDHLVVLYTAREGELFAESSLFADIYHCDAVAASQARVRAYPKQQFLTALRATPSGWEYVTSRLAHQLQRLRTQMELRNIRSARERVLQFLRLNADATERIVRIEGDLQDLAAELGLSREALYRTLARLEGEGAIVRNRNTIVLEKSQSI